MGCVLIVWSIVNLWKKVMKNNMDITEYTRSVNDANQAMFKAKYGLKEYHSDSRIKVELWLKAQCKIKDYSLDTMVEFIDSIGKLNKD